jgi:hypothetical protein
MKNGGYVVLRADIFLSNISSLYLGRWIEVYPSQVSKSSAYPSYYSLPFTGKQFFPCTWLLACFRIEKMFVFWCSNGLFTGDGVEPYYGIM